MTSPSPNQTKNGQKKSFFGIPKGQNTLFPDTQIHFPISKKNVLVVLEFLSFCSHQHHVVCWSHHPLLRQAKFRDQEELKFRVPSEFSTNDWEKHVQFQSWKLNANVIFGL